MATVTEKYNLELVPGGAPLCIHVSQFDTDRAFVFTPYYKGSLFEHVEGGHAYVEATKPDHTIVVSDLTYSDDGTITMDLSGMEDLTTAAGDARAKIRITNADEKTLASTTIILAIDLAGLDTYARLSKSNIDALEDAIASGANALAAVAAAEASATQAANSAKEVAKSVTAAADSATAADTFAQAAATSESNASTSAQNAATSEDNASGSATRAESWAVGGTGTRDGEDKNNSKYYAEEAAKSAEEAASLAATAVDPGARMMLLEYMDRFNDHFCPILDDDQSPILDDEGNAILGDWKYKYA